MLCPRRAQWMLYLRSRYYDATEGRFTRMDPFSGVTESPMSLHKYVYATNDPVSYVDPSGLEILEAELGKAAHRAITMYYTFDHLSDALALGIVPWGVTGLGMIPDVVNLKRATMLEIKPNNPWAIREGAVQLNGYLGAANLFNLAGKGGSWTGDLWLPKFRFFWLGAANPKYLDYFGVITGNKGGVLT